MPERTILIDGDVYAYQAAAGVEQAINWGSDVDPDSCLWTLHAEDGDAFNAVDTALEEITKKLGGDRMVVALSHKDNWRMDVLPTYKGNRSTTRKPLVLPAVRQYIRDTYEVWERPGLEGDDILGILATLKSVIPGEKIIVTIDKDLSTIPGFHFRPHKFGQGIFEVTREEADRFHIMQGIAGDPTDGYVGCPGWGMGTADEYLKDPYILVQETRELKSGPRKGEEITQWKKEPTDDLWAGILSLYAKAGYNEAFALQQFRVARILRGTDYDFKKKEPILWTPDLLPD